MALSEREQIDANQDAIEFLRQYIQHHVRRQLLEAVSGILPSASTTTSS